MSRSLQVQCLTSPVVPRSLQVHSPQVQESAPALPFTLLPLDKAGVCLLPYSLLEPYLSRRVPLVAGELPAGARAAARADGRGVGLAAGRVVKVPSAPRSVGAALAAAEGEIVR